MKKLTFISITLAALGVNLFLGIRFFHQLEDFRLKNGPISMEVMDEVPQGPLNLMDIDGDKEDELIYGFLYYTNPLELRVYDPLKKKYKLKSSEKIIVPNTYFFLDASYNNNSKTYVFKFQECVEKSLFIRDIDQHNNVLKETRFEHFIQPFPKTTVRFVPLGLLDLQQDGKKELLIRLMAGYSRYPRGLACYHPESGKLLWDYRCGPSVYDVVIKDLDGNGKKEIVFSTIAVNNGAKINGTSDAYSYVIALDSSGEELWKRKVGGWYTHSYIDVSDLDHDGTFEIVATTACHQVSYKNRGEIFIFDGITGKEKDHYLITDASFSKPLVRKCEKNKTKIYVGDSNGRLWIFDEDLDPKVKTVKENSPISVLNNTGRGYPTYSYLIKSTWPYLTICTLSELVVYDWEVETKRFQYSFQRPFIIRGDIIYRPFISGTTRQESYAFLNADKFYQLSEVKGSAARIIKHLVTTGLIPTGMIFFLFNGFIIYLFYRFKTSSGDPSEKAPEVEMSHFFESLQEMAHQLKNPISTLLWTAEKIKRSSNRDKNKMSIDAGSYHRLSHLLLDDVKKLQTRTDNMLELIRGQSIMDVHHPDKDLEK